MPIASCILFPRCRLRFTGCRSHPGHFTTDTGVLTQAEAAKSAVNAETTRTPGHTSPFFLLHLIAAFFAALRPFHQNPGAGSFHRDRVIADGDPARAPVPLRHGSRLFAELFPINPDSVIRVIVFCSVRASRDDQGVFVDLIIQILRSASGI